LTKSLKVLPNKVFRFFQQTLIKKIYNTQSLQRDTEDKNLAETKDKLLRLVTSSSATISAALRPEITVDSHGVINTKSGY
jgi:hypothetical protein